jgi:hypothetical protein
MAADVLPINTQETPPETTQENSPQELSEDLQKELRALWQKCVTDGITADRQEVRDVWQAHFYWRGLQYTWWSEKEGRLKLLSQATDRDIDNPDEMPRFQYVTNIYQSRGLGYIAAVAGAAPRIRFFPDDADNPDDLETAQADTKLAKAIERWNPTKKLLQEEAHLFWMDGVVGAYVRRVADGEKFGTESVASLSSQETELAPETMRCAKCGWEGPAQEVTLPVPCPQCGQPLTEENLAPAQNANIPAEGGEEEFAKTRVVITPVGALNLKRPQWCKEQGDFHYLVYEREVHFSKARAAFPKKAKEIKGGIQGGGVAAYRRIARLSTAQGTTLLSQTGDALASLVTISTVWFRKDAFYMLDDETKRDELIAAFPDGCKVIFVGDTYCESAPESMDDAWVIEHAYPGDGQHRPAVGSSMISVQDRFNTESNIETETYEYGQPITYRASDTFDPDASKEQISEPGSEVQVALRANENISNRIMTTSPASVSPSMTQHMQELRGPLSDEMSGVYPALAGADTDQKTLGGQAMQRDQAMGRMGISYSRLKQFHANVMTLACRALRSEGTGKISTPVLAKSGEFESESVDVTALEGESQAYPEGDENFPEGWAQKRAVAMQVADSPQGQMLLQDPDNQQVFLDLLGIPELVSPDASSRKKQLREIKELKPQPQAEAAIPNGQPPVQNPLAEMLIDPEFDNHPAELATCVAWLNGEEGQRAKKDEPEWFTTVRAHALEHKQLIEPPVDEKKPISVAVATDKMVPEAQAQILEKIDVHVQPQDFAAAAALEKAKKPQPILSTRGNVTAPGT